MRISSKIVVGAFVAGLFMSSAASAAQIEYTFSALVSGSYRDAPTGTGTGTYTNALITLKAYGDTAVASPQAWGSNAAQPPLKQFNTVATTYASATIAGFAGGLNLSYFGGDPTVLAISNGSTPFYQGGFIMGVPQGPQVGRAALTELLPNGHLQSGGFFQGVGLLGWDGKSALGVTSITSLDPLPDGDDIAFADGTIFSHTSLSSATFGARLLTGLTTGDALLPNAPSEDGYGFTFEASEGQTVYIDPLVAVGYDYVLGAGSPLITSAVLPTLPGSAYQIFALNDLVNPLSVNFLSDPSGLRVDFTTLAGYSGGINGFRLTGINPGAGLDPTDGHAFVTGLTFGSGGTVNVSQNALSISVPEPSTWALMLLGFGGLGGMLRSRRRALSPA